MTFSGWGYDDPQSLLADSLDVPGPLTSTSIRETVAAGGNSGLVEALDQAGVLESLAGVCEEIRDFTAERVREAPALASVLDLLPADEADELVEVTSAAIIRNTAREEDR